MPPPPILLIASRHDQIARDFAARAGGVLLMSAADLSAGGWSYRPGEIRSSTLRVGGVDLAACDLGGAMTRLPWINEAELPHIHAEDQAYVAAEMNALLVAWLNELPCPVLNRATPASLAGPAWRREQWAWQALRLGIPSADGQTDTPPVTAVTVIGGEASAGADPELATHARRLAAAAGVDCLKVEFGGEGGEGRFLAADPLPDLADDWVAGRLLAWFGRGPVAS